MALAVRPGCLWRKARSILWNGGGAARAISASSSGGQRSGSPLAAIISSRPTGSARFPSMRRAFSGESDPPSKTLLHSFAVSTFGGPAAAVEAVGKGLRPSTNARPWKASELREKSFDDLQRLWVVMLRARNALHSERDFCRSNNVHWAGSSDLWKLKKSMARLKTVVGERTRARAHARAARKMAATTPAEASVK
ncbi:hypothetical protein CDCA_CDCA13G3671 [Cyanidium caldarium]|uniref:Large ribosomal subunit protein uL29m n=1 Tax=Cyanidium caldarium TaxID=2771 RepID=A0AAV9IZT3_CYACA|nr:hypothetical protein CDCA_CDCA13G3671 [Cyanidium caldarium]